MSKTKVAVIALVTMLVQFVIIFVASYLLKSNFFDLTLIAGAVLTGVVYFLSGSGGIFSKMMDVQTQAATTVKMDIEQTSTKLNPVLLGSLSYTALSLIVTVIYYWDAF